MTVPNTDNKEPFSGQLAIECLLVENEFLNDLLDRYGQERGAKIKPAFINVKFVLTVLAVWTFYKPEYKLTCANETHQQLATYTGLGLDAIQNVLGFLTWAGFLETIRHGGGVNRLATVRKVYSTTATQRDNNLTQRDIPRLVTTELNGYANELNGYANELNGYGIELDGVLPVTPSINQVINQNIDQASNEKINKTLIFGDISVRALIPHQDDPAPNDIAARMAMEQAKTQIAADKAERAKRNRAATTS